MAMGKHQGAWLALLASAGGCDASPAMVRGVAASSASAGEGSGAPGDRLFDAPLLDVYLTLETSALRELDEHGNLEQFVPASVRVEREGAAPVAFERLGVRYKGSYTLHHCWDDFGGVRSHAGDCAKLSLKLDFDRYDASSRLDGLKQLNLHAAAADASKLRELVAYQTFREAGVDAPRALPARVFVNGEPRGLFIAVEEVDGRYTTGHYPAGPGGNLYKEVWPNTGATDAELLAALRTNEEAGDVSDMRAFAAAVARAASGDAEAELEPFVELDALLRYIAVDRAILAWDGIMAFYTPRSPHNFYWYHDDGPAPRFHLIPWDLDETFWPFDPYMAPEQWVTAAPVPDFNERPLDCEPRPIWKFDGPERLTPPLCDPLLAELAERHWARFAELGRELLAGPLSEASLLARVEHWRERIEPLAMADASIDPLAWERALVELRLIMGERAASFAAFVDGGLGAEVVPVPIEPPRLDNPDVETLDDGLHAGALTNFEFAEPPGGTPAGVYTFADPRATVAARWSLDAPLSGSADLRFDFAFARGPEAYDEWVGLGLSCVETDVRRFSTIVVLLAADLTRSVRVRLASPVYTEEFGGIPAELGQDVVVGPEPRAVALERAGFYYPSWAKDAWQAGQGFAVDDEAIERVLARFGGLVFSPGPTLDAAGELASATEIGRLRVDNVYFVE
jgi:spore coat protein H